MTDIKFNIGEWSELYAFLKILEQRNLPAADSGLLKIPNVYYPVSKIQRNDKNTSRFYDLNSKNNIQVHINSGVLQEKYDVPYETLTEQLPSILMAIKAAGKNAKGSFALPEAKSLIELLKPGKIKQDSKTKEDIILVLRDHITAQESTVGFSIKSYLGGNASLINASQPTHFRFSVTNANFDMNEANQTSGYRKLRKRVEFVQQKGGIISFSNMLNPIFEKNLRKIDSYFPEIIGEIILAFFSTECRSIHELTKYIIEKKKLKGPILEKFDYQDIKFKIKQLLLNAALGMVPATNWDGIITADGGYVIVKEDGEVVCYHVYNISELSEYLFNNTKLETPSSGRHPFAEFFEKSGKIFYDYPLQIRFS